MDWYSTFTFYPGTSFSLQNFPVFILWPGILEWRKLEMIKV